ncbi:hypothetical protein ACIBLB_09530 [Streptosporangium canum]|uniref:hypothetical protein n=1 Tax=Streptosporangium canum TaxID=324952 RepID=UPI0037915D34
MPAFLMELQWLCQVWGGAGQPIIPVIDGKLPAPYVRLLQTEQVDHVGGLDEDLEFEVPWRVVKEQPWDYPAIVVASREPLEKWRPVHLVDLRDDDPWKVIYACTLGIWPEHPDPQLSEFVGIRDDLRFEEIVPVERQMTTGSLDDLIRRLSDGDHFRPRQVSNMFLASGLSPDTGFMGANEILPQPQIVRRAAGPNIIVVMTPGSVEDAALLWNLRVAHGDGRVLPIGLPVTEVTSKSLNDLQRPGRATYFGWGGGKCYLTSASLDFEDLTALAALSPSAKAARYDDLLTFGHAPGRPRSHVTFWREGRSRIAPLSESDQDTLRPTRLTLRKPQMVLDVYVRNHLLPADSTMRGREFGPRFQAGSAQVSVSDLRRENTVEVSWPPSWTSLAAVAKTRGLKVSSSEAGLAAATLIKSLGSIDAIRWLQHRPLIELLYRLAERSGMAWWKQRWTSAHQTLLAAGADPATLENAAQLLGRDDPAVAPPGEGRALPFEEFRKVFRNDTATQRWMVWAERAHLLVRGTNITCTDCNSTSWLPMASLPPPVGCSGCGREIHQPYGPRELRFTYRIGEPLRRVLETDSFGHLLALRWLTRLFDEHGLVGAHPGVNFIDPTSGKTVGEADVLLLFDNGALVPVEVKRRVGGVEGRTEKLLDALADALDAPYDFLVVTQPARDCESLKAFSRRLPHRPRLLLTDDQLHEKFAIWSVGQDPFAWSPRTPEQDAVRELEFTRWLAENDLDAVHDRVSDYLLE